MIFPFKQEVLRQGDFVSFVNAVNRVMKIRLVRATERYAVTCRTERRRSR
jgi:hypothetical protein